ncbi:hypothetical protein [Halovivax asiaticus]|uniref:hypothetical protein n=1 Tax=Halovivax asiaticus TaxID=332953 RepID=UPI000677BD27|nr:hypothetical protein [Halovivax asiaticus]
MPAVLSDGNVLTIGGTDIEVDHPIGQVLEMEDRVLVLLSPSQDAGRDRQNVLAFSYDGDLLWKSGIPEKSDRHMFGSLTTEDGDIIGWSWNKHEYRIDPETGELEDRGFRGK